MELGLYTFGELTPDPSSGRAISPQRRLRELLAEIELADRVGLDVFGVGEHHRPDFAVSAPAVVLAAAAARTERIRLSSAVSVISSDDPVRVFQSFATLDLLSGGRAEIMAGRGGFSESFPLFGCNIDDYDDLFTEKLALLLELRAGERVTWSGRHRPAIDDLGVYPRPLQDPIPIWIAGGGNMQSTRRTGGLGLPLALALINTRASRFKPIAKVHRRAAAAAGHPEPPLSVNAYGHIAESTAAALDDSFEPFATTVNRIGAERGWPPLTRADYEASAELDGANFVGSPEDVVEKILYQHELFGQRRTLIHFAIGSLAHDEVMRSIELFGTEVAPAVRRALGPRTDTATEQEKERGGAG